MNLPTLAPILSVTSRFGDDAGHPVAAFDLHTLVNPTVYARHQRLACLVCVPVHRSEERIRRTCTHPTPTSSPPLPCYHPYFPIFPRPRAQSLLNGSLPRR
jgi:hypothetical protein